MSKSPLMQYTDDQVAGVYKDIGRSQSELVENTIIIKEWMKKQPHLPEIMSDDRIERFLLMNKFSLEKCKKKIDMYYSLRSLIPEIYQNRNPNSKRIQNIMNVVAHLPTRKLTADLRRIVCFRLFDTDPNKFIPMDLFAYTFLIADVRVCEDYCSGDIALFDLTGMKFDHLVKFTPAMLKKVISIVESQLSSRLSGIHFVNGPQFLETFLNVLRTVLPQKFVERIHVHKDYEAMHKVLPKEVLPSDFQGDDISLQEMQVEWRKKLLEYSDFFDKSEGLTTNEKLRPGSPIKYFFSDLELQGSFRKLNID